MRAKELGGVLLIVLAAAGAVASTRTCGKTGPTPRELADYPSLEGTLCDVIAKAPPAQPRGPLPSDPALAAWTVRVESALEDALALDAIRQAHNYGYGPVPSEAETACVRKLWTNVAAKLPPGRMRSIAESAVSRLSQQEAGTLERDKLAAVRQSAPDASAPLPASSSADLIERVTSVTSNTCETVPKYLAAFPDNPRLRRALMVHYGACVEDNFNSVDGELDATEIFMRETVKSWPDRAGLDFELLVAADPSSQDPRQSTWIWLRAPFARIPLDLGTTGNALRVVGDLKKERPDIAKQLLPVARKRAASNIASSRRARWTALVAYLEADTPDPGDHPEPALARALEADERSARWALGYLPNELQEHAPRPFPYLRDPAVIKATVARAELVTTDEDRILVLDVLSQMPPGTALARMAAWTSSPNESVWRAAMAAIDKQINQLPIKADPGELEAGAERRRHAAKLLAPHLSVLRTSLAPRICAHADVITFLADADDLQIDDEVLPCIEGKPQPDTGFIGTLFTSCLHHRTLGWAKSGTALAKTALPDDNGAYARRVSNGCINGED